jgi:hypothetical protein
MKWRSSTGPWIGSEKRLGVSSLSEALVFLAADSLAGESQSVSTADRYTVVIHAGEDGTAWTETAAGPAPLKPEVVERLLCDASIRLAREEADGTFSLSRRQRTIPIVTRRAIEIRDGRRCRVQGCKHKLWLDIHHRKEYEKGGRHDKRNLMLLCRYHHRMYHEKRLLIEGDIKSGLRFIIASNGWAIGETTKESEETLRLWEEQLAMCAIDAEWEAMRAAVGAVDDVPHWNPEESAFGASIAGEETKRFRGIVVGSVGLETPVGTWRRPRLESARRGEFKTIPRNRRLLIRPENHPPRSSATRWSRSR